MWRRRKPYREKGISCQLQMCKDIRQWSGPQVQMIMASGGARWPAGGRIMPPAKIDRQSGGGQTTLASLRVWQGLKMSRVDTGHDVQEGPGQGPYMLCTR